MENRPSQIVNLQIDMSGVRERAEYILDLPRPVLWFILFVFGYDLICKWCARKARVVACGIRSSVSSSE